MQRLIEYLEENNIDFTKVDDSIVNIDNKNFLLVESKLLPTEDGDKNLLFDKDFNLILTDFEESINKDYYIIRFGGRYYYLTSSSDIQELKYLGKSKQSGFPFLGIHSGNEILNGSRLYEDWVKKAKFLGVETLGICEKNSLAGVVKFQQACQKGKIKPIIGEEIVIKSLKDELYRVKLYPISEEGWISLLRINRELKAGDSFGKYIEENKFLKLVNFKEFILIIDPKWARFDQCFPISLSAEECYYQLDTVEFELNEVDKKYLENLKIFIKSSIEPILIVDAYYLDKEDYFIKNILNSISNTFENKSSNQYFKSLEDYSMELYSLFNNDELFTEKFNKAFGNLLKVCDTISFSVKLGERHLPRFMMTEEQKSNFETNEDLFWSLITEGFSKIAPEDQMDFYLERLQEEVGVIQKGDIVDYFLILWDVFEWAKSNNILTGIGRGSAGGSLVSACLGIIKLDPIEFDLLFSRFLNEGRIKKSLPDIDSDFPAERRTDVKRYIENKYGINQVCSVGTYTAMQAKSCIKDISRIFNVPFDEVNNVTKLIGEDDKESFFTIFRYGLQYKTIKDFINKYPEIINSVPLLLGQPKAESVHPCAIVIFPDERNMFEWCPIKKVGDEYVSEWEGAEMEAVGFLKEDILGIKQLDKFTMILDLIKRNHGIDVDIYNIPLDEEEVFAYFQNGWNSDVFHFGSHGLTNYCKQLQPENIDDLIAAISLYRPGAMENNFHNEYVIRKRGEKEYEYLVGSEQILNNTYGVFCYQEQIMKLCQVLGGLSSVEADDVRKAMVKKKYEELTKYKERFIPYYMENFGVTENYALKAWDQIDKASTYLFNKSHAAAYTITGYICQWLKIHYPIEFWTSAFHYSEADDVPIFISEINELGDIFLYPPDINKSMSGFSSDFKNNIIFWGLMSIKGFGDIGAKQLIELNPTDGYFSFEDFLTKNTFKGSKINKGHIESFIICGVFDQIENITKPSQRAALLDYFYSSNKIKDFSNEYKKYLDDNWWWLLNQRKLCGFAIFNYQELFKESGLKGNFYDDLSEAKNEEEVFVAGYVTRIDERLSKRGKMLNIDMDCNYKTISIKIWAEQYPFFIDNLRNCKESIIIFNGLYDKKRNEVQSFSDSECLVIS